MAVIDELVQNNEDFASSFDKGDLPMPDTPLSGYIYDVKTDKLETVIGANG